MPQGKKNMSAGRFCVDFFFVPLCLKKRDFILIWAHEQNPQDMDLGRRYQEGEERPVLPRGVRSLPPEK